MSDVQQEVYLIVLPRMGSCDINICPDCYEGGDGEGRRGREGRNKDRDGMGRIGKWRAGRKERLR